MAAPTKGFCAKVGPSILNSDLSLLASECQRMLDAGADYLHLDVMDGHFVPNLTFGHPVVKCLRQKIEKAFLDMHMMVTNPEQWICPMNDAGADQYTFHIESTNDPPTCIRKIKECGMKVGLAIKPKTEISTVIPYIDCVDMVLVMTVEPGFGGQSFMSDMMPKVRYLRDNYCYLDIEVDGGVNTSNIEVCAAAGANMIVSGTAVMNSDNPTETMNFMRTTVDDAILKTQLER